MSTGADQRLQRYIFFLELCLSIRFFGFDTPLKQEKRISLFSFLTKFKTEFVHLVGSIGPPSFHGHALGEIAGLIDIQSFHDGHMIGDQLQRNH